MLQQHLMHGSLFDEERLTAKAMSMSLSGNELHNRMANRSSS